MRKHLLFSVMLSLCAMGGMMVYSTPVMATVAQSPTIKVRGQVIPRVGSETNRNFGDMHSALAIHTFCCTLFLPDRKH